MISLDKSIRHLSFACKDRISIRRDRHDLQVVVNFSSIILDTDPIRKLLRIKLRGKTKEEILG